MKYIMYYEEEAIYLDEQIDLDYPTVSYTEDTDDVKYKEKENYIRIDFDLLSSETKQLFSSYLNLNTIETILINGEPQDINYSYTLPQGQSSIKVIFNTSMLTNTSYMFFNCSGLTSLDLSSFNTSNVTDMSGMFKGCLNLTSIDLSSFDTSNITSMYQMFYGCSGLTSIDVSSFDTSNVTNMSEMFSGCDGLTSLDLSSFDTSNVLNMRRMFEKCSGLTTLDLISFDTSNVYDIMYMFYNCKSLTSIKFGAQAYIGSTAMLNCYGMFGNITTTGTLYYPSAYESAWNNILVTKQSSSLFPSTWTAQISYVPSECTSLLISAEDVRGKKTNTVISYTAITKGYDYYTNSQVEGVAITGTAISDSFEQNTSTTDTVQRTITFEYMGVTASTTITQGVYVLASYTVNLNSQWQLSSTVANPDSVLYDGVYESFSNKGVGNSIAKMTIDIEGYDNFKLYIRSYAESSYDYTMASQLDQDLTNGSTGSTYMKASTRGKQSSDTSINGYTLVEYANIDEGEHTITIGYRKDSSGNSGDDRGYLLIPKDQ